MRPILLIAGVYNLAWGLFTIAAPEWLFRFAGIEPPRYPELWQCIGMIVGVYGIGYAVAAFDPLRHWPIVLVGFLGKVLGPIGFAGALINGTFPLAFGATILTNDLIWWWPFGAILWAAFRENATVTDPPVEAVESAVESLIVEDDGRSVAEVSTQRPLFAVLLRHAGCTFHREALTDLKQALPEIDAAGAQLAIVHMGDGPNEIESGTSRYALSGVPHVADPRLLLYRAAGLPRGELGQLFGWREFTRGAAACVLEGHGVGALKGDGFQLGGLALIRDGQIVWSRALASASERPDYASEARSALAALA